MFMKRSLVLSFLLFLNVGCSSFPQAFTPQHILLKDPKYRAEYEERIRQEEMEEAAKVLALAPIKRIFLGDFGNGEGSDLVREKLRIRLQDSNRFDVVERQQNADAMLTGVAGVERGYSHSVSTDSYGNARGSGGTDYRGLGVLRLVDLKAEKTIWHFEYQRGLMLGGSVSSRVANQIADALLADTEKADAYAAKQEEAQGTQ